MREELPMTTLVYMSFALCSSAHTQITDIVPHSHKDEIQVNIKACLLYTLKHKYNYCT